MHVHLVRHIEHMIIRDVIKVHEYLHVGLARTNLPATVTREPPRIDGDIAHV